MKTVLVIFCLLTLCFSCKKEETTNPNESINILSYASQNGDSLQLDSVTPAMLNISFISPSYGTYKVVVTKGDAIISTANYVNAQESPSAFNDVMRFWKSSTDYGIYSWYIQKQETGLKTESRSFILCQKKK